MQFQHIKNIHFDMKIVHNANKDEGHEDAQQYSYKVKSSGLKFILKYYHKEGLFKQ